MWEKERIYKFNKSNKTSIESSEKAKDDNKSNINKEKENKDAEKIDDDSFVNPKI